MILDTGQLREVILKNYLISGAAGGIGLQTAKDLLNAHNKVAIIDVKSFPKELESFKDRIIYVEGSSSDEDVVGSLVRKIQSDWGELHGLINNAGVMIRKPLRDLSLAEWNKVLDTHLTSAFLLSREALPLLIKAKGTIVNIASTRAHQSEPDTESYAASKGALLALTHSLAMSLGPDVRVNCVSPGWIDSRPKSEREAKPLKTSDHEQHPVGRVGRMEDVSHLIQWLLSDQSSFITGQEFITDGGMTRKMIYEE